MYQSHFGLTSKPFQLIPDPSFYFGSKQHSRAKAYLEYGVSRNEGFVVITGEIGAGKTTILRTLIEGLHGSNVVTGHLVTTQLGAEDTLRMVGAAFGFKVKDVPKSELLITLEAFLISQTSQGKRCLLVAALMTSIGLHWAVLQSAAWVGMAVAYSVERGSVVLDPGLHRPTERIDAIIEVLPGETKPLRQWHPVRVHHAAAEVAARLVPLRDLADERKVIAPGERDYAQLVLEAPQNTTIVVTGITPGRESFMPLISSACVSLPPKPPPMRSDSHTTSCAGRPSTCATTACVSLGCWVEHSTAMPWSSAGMAKLIWPSR